MPAELLTKSTLLHEALIEVFASAAPSRGQRFSLAMEACGKAFEHAAGIRRLIGTSLNIPASELLRVQFEALVQAMWLFYAATDVEIENLLAPLNNDTKKAANKLPVATEMLEALEKHGPPVAVRPLLQLKAISARPMNSFIRSGVYSPQRHRDGFPAVLLYQLVMSSNGLNTMCAMLAATLSANMSSVRTVSILQRIFAEILPPLEHLETMASTNGMA